MDLDPSTLVLLNLFLCMVEDLSYALDQQKQTYVILLDFAKAFDSVPHQRLLKVN